MGAKKPLALYSGQIQQLQSGDTLDAVVSEVELLSLTNKNASTIPICAPVYMKATADQCDLAKADAAGTTEVLGLVKDAAGIAADATGNIQTGGLMVATTGQWDAAAGTTGGLAAGTRYWLSAATAGKLTATCPTTGYNTFVGVGINSTSMLITIDPAMKL